MSFKTKNLLQKRNYVLVDRPWIYTYLWASDDIWNQWIIHKPILCIDELSIIPMYGLAWII